MVNKPKAAITIPTMDLHRALRLPPHMKIMGVEKMQDSRAGGGLELHIEGKGLPLYPGFGKIKKLTYNQFLELMRDYYGADK